MKNLIIILLTLNPILVFSQKNEENCHSSEKQLSDYADTLFSKGFSGSILILKEDTPLLFVSKGNVNGKTSKEIDNSSLFYLASDSKQFTAAGIVKLQSQGKLNVNDELSNFFPRIPLDKKDITIHQLLTHSSGLQEYRAKAFEKIDKTEMLQRVFSDTLLFKPGESYAYSNQGYGLLAAIIEEVTKDSFQNFMHKTFFEPLGMINTGFLGEKSEGTPVNGHFNGKNHGSVLDWDGHAWGHLGSGGMYSSINDLKKWELGLLSNEVLSKKEQDILFKEQYKTRTNYFGYGVRVTDTEFRGHLNYHFGSEINGFSSGIMRFTDVNISVIVLSNIGNDEIAYAIDTALKIAHKVFDCEYNEYPKY